MLRSLSFLVFISLLHVFVEHCHPAILLIVIDIEEDFEPRYIPYDCCAQNVRPSSVFQCYFHNIHRYVFVMYIGYLNMTRSISSTHFRMHLCRKTPRFRGGVSVLTCCTRRCWRKLDRFTVVRLPPTTMNNNHSTALVRTLAIE